jgi:phospholipase/lecithinase/hemolysin
MGSTFRRSHHEDIMPRSFLVRLLLLSSLLPAPGLAAYSNIYFFGDSLSDNGNDFILSSSINANNSAFPIVPSPAGYAGSGRFSNGPVYSELLAAQLGFSLQPSLLGGTNYAYGGARAGSVALPFSRNFTEQVEQYIGAPDAADPNALYVLFIGANDVQDIVLGAPSAATIANAITRIGDAIQSLAQEGVGHFLIPNAPDLGLVPFATGNGAIARNPLATAASLAFNEALAGLLEGFGALDIQTFDTFALLNEIVANPATYGLADVQHWCQRETGTDANGQPQYEILCTAEEAEDHLFWDYIHPTAAGHRALAAAMFATLQVPEPDTLALLATALVLAACSVRVTRGQRPRG